MFSVPLHYLNRSLVEKIRDRRTGINQLVTICFHSKDLTAVDIMKTNPIPTKKKVKIKTIIIESDDAPNSHVFNIV